MKLNVSVLLLFVALSISAQPVLTFDKVQHDFGRVNEADGPVSHNFTFKNTGTAPLVIQNVLTTCGCTTPEWTRQPIRPGEAGFITVEYDVKGRPGAIDKSIAVHSNGSSTAINLRIIGEVNPLQRNHSEQFRHAAGPIRLEDMHLSFSRMYHTENPSLLVNAFNPSPDAVSISFINLPAHIRAEVSPTTVRSGERATIRVTYDAARKNDWGFVSDQISMILNNDRTRDYKLTVTATIEEDFSRWTAAQLQNAPAISIDPQPIMVGQIKKGEKKTIQVRMTNTGKGKLLIRKVSPTNSLTLDAPKEINAGASANLTITFDSAGLNGQVNRTIEMITNDPKNAKISLRLRAEVV